MTIRLRLLLLVLGIALLPAILVGVRYYQDRGKEIDATITGMAATARSIASNFDAKIQATAQLHFWLVARPRPRPTRQDGVFELPVGGAREEPAIYRTPDH